MKGNSICYKKTALKEFLKKKKLFRQNGNDTKGEVGTSGMKTEQQKWEIPG